MKALFFCLLALCVPLPAMAEAPLAVTEIAPGVFLHQAQQHWPDQENHGEIANIGFIVGERCVAVIDSGGSPRQGIALRNAIKQHSAKPVCYVINTHVHPDHIYGNQAFKQPGVQFVGHYKLAKAMAARGAYYLERAEDLLALHLTPDAIVPPDLQVKEQMKLDLGKRELLLTAHGSAHTDNDLSIYDSASGTLWLADLLFLEHIPVIDGSLTGWLRELDKLAKNQYKLVVPGHGRLVRDWPAALQPERSYLQNLATQVRGQIKQGRTLEHALNTVGIDAKQDWALFDKFHRKNVTLAFTELEWED